jgi:hypothetical protein
LPLLRYLTNSVEPEPKGSSLHSPEPTAWSTPHPQVSTPTYLVYIWACVCNNIWHRSISIKRKV